MDLKNALEIMGLKAPLTEQQFKKKLRELLRIYHPDHNTKEKQEESEKITKKILEAKEVIENYFENQKQFSDALNYDGVGYQDIEKIFKAQKQEKDKFRNILNSYYIPCKYNSLSVTVKKLIEQYETRITGNQNQNQILLRDFLEELKTIYINFINQHMKIFHIPDFIINEYKFNYYCDCKELVSQLEKCTNKLEKDIDKIIEPIKEKEHYNILSKEINKIKSTLQSAFREQEITKKQYEKLLEIYNNKIQLLYDEYERKYYRLILLITLTSSNPNNYETKKNIKQAQNDALELPEEEIIKIYYQTINKLDSKLKNKNDIEKKINERYELRDLNTPEEKSKARNLYYKILKMLREKNCPLEMILLFNDINFINIDLEEKKVSKFRKVFMRKIKEEPIVCFTKYHSNKLYIAEKKPILNGNKFFYDIRPNINRTLCPSSIFKRMYINIDDFIEQSIFLGEQVYYNYEYEHICLLYHNINAGKILCLNENSEFEIIDDIVLKEYHTYKNKHLNIYKDKEYLKYKILKFIQGEQLDNNKKQTR